MAAKEVIRTNNLTKVFGQGGRAVKAVDNVSLTINEAEIVGLVGESGSGKSTLARLILNLIVPTGGEVYFGGEKIYAINSAILRQNLQIVFQDPYSSLNARQRVFDILYEPLYIHKKFSKARVYELLDLVKLSRAFERRFPHELSGGERQRVAIARALALNPKVLICDEPVSSLDVSIRAEILKLLKEIQSQFNLALLFISHDLAVVYNFCHRLAVMHDGKIVESGLPSAIFARPAEVYTAKLINAIPRRLFRLLG